MPTNVPNKTTKAPISDDFELPSLENLCLNVDKTPISEVLKRAIVHYMPAPTRVRTASALPTTFGKLDRTVPHWIMVLKFEKNAMRVDTERVQFVHQCWFAHLRGLCLCPLDVDEMANPVNLRLPANQHLKEGDIVWTRRADDPHKEPLKRNNPTNTKATSITLKKTIQNGVTGQEKDVPLPRGIKFPDAMRAVSEQYLGGDRVHEVNMLDVEMIEAALRLPVGIQLKVKQLGLSYNALEALKAVRPIIHPSSWPLKKVHLSLDHPGDPILFNLPDARRINITLPMCLIPEASNWKIFAMIHHPDISLYGFEILVMDWVLIAAMWNRTPRPLGFRFSMASKNRVSHYIDGVKDKIEGAQIKLLPSKPCSKYPFCVSIPLNAETELNVYGAKSPYYEQEMKVAPEERILWQVVMEVMAKGSAEDAVE